MILPTVSLSNILLVNAWSRLSPYAVRCSIASSAFGRNCLLLSSSFLQCSFFISLFPHLNLAIVLIGLLFSSRFNCSCIWCSKSWFINLFVSSVIVYLRVPCCRLSNHLMYFSGTLSISSTSFQPQVSFSLCC